MGLKELETQPYPEYDQRRTQEAWSHTINNKLFSPQMTQNSFCLLKRFSKLTDAWYLIVKRSLDSHTVPVQYCEKLGTAIPVPKVSYLLFLISSNLLIEKFTVQMPLATVRVYCKICKNVQKTKTYAWILFLIFDLALFLTLSTPHLLVQSQFQ